MTCEEMVELVTNYLEGTLPAADHLRFESHIAECQGCHHYLDQMRKTIDLTGRIADDTLVSVVRDTFLRLFRDWRKT
ncbi:MAG: zf-HC2 domain-containing protein [Chloroflexi bacterium]|nr:zf-HC2 domain-containing protein [Chloroflexota bacterium]